MRKNYKQPNDIIVCKDYAEVVLCDKYRQITNKTIIDIEDIDKVSKYIWCFKKDNGYVWNSNNSLYLHRLIADAKKKEYVDHINGDKLDNRKCNLRICTNSQNNMNKGLQSNNTSGVAGVSWSKRYNKWRVRIKIDGKEKHLGYFDNIEDAKQARIKGEIKYFNEFRYKGDS